jgi:hypothetical protein
MQKSARKLDQWARSWLRARAAPGRWSGALESVLVERHGTTPGREGVFTLQIIILILPKFNLQRSFGEYSNRIAHVIEEIADNFVVTH